jgi:ABC-type uncharacterized transport system permease subunit
MPSMTMMSISASLALLPAALLAYRRQAARDRVFWLLLAVAFAGPLLWVWVGILPGWRTGLAAALWATVTMSLVVFAVVAAATRQGWRLAPLLMPYLLVLGVLATIWQDQPGRPFAAAAPEAWIGLHIAFSVVTYAVLTVAAVAGLAGFLQDRAIKGKRTNRLVRLMPSIADSEALQVRLLGFCAVVMGLGVITGMAIQFFTSAALLVFDHKTLLSLATLAVIVGLLVAHWRSGVRGRRAARLVLLAYLLLTLGYPGVKFVTDILMA